MERIDVEEARRNLEDVLLLVENARRRVLLVEGEGDPVCALLPTEDIELLESLDGSREVATERVAQKEVARHFRADLDEVRSRRERLVVLQGERERAVLAPLSDLRRLVELDERLDLEVAKRLLERRLDGGEETAGDREDAPGSEPPAGGQRRDV